jgi:hypothetical protein
MEITVILGVECVLNFGLLKKSDLVQYDSVKSFSIVLSLRRTIVARYSVHASKVAHPAAMLVAGKIF